MVLNWLVAASQTGRRMNIVDSSLMNPKSDVLSNRALSAGTLLVLLALSGCAGGGGGGGASASGSPAGFSYPSSLSTAKSSDTVRGFVSPYALDTTTHELHAVQQNILAVGSVTGKLVLTVAAIPLPTLPQIEPGFIVTFDPASGGLLLNSPIESLCHDCLRTVSVKATALVGGSAPGDVTFTYLDPGSIGLNYSTLGIWSKPTTVQSTWSEVGGPFSAGVMTRGIDLPTTGSAIYKGFFIGRYATLDTTSGPPVGTYLVGANARADVNFSGPGAVMFSTSNTTISGGALTTPLPVSQLDLTSTAMPITRTSSSNSFAGGGGTLTNGFGMGATGQIRGAFYGPPAATAPYAPPELGGSLAVGNASGTQKMVGSFGLKKQ